MNAEHPDWKDEQLKETMIRAAGLALLGLGVAAVLGATPPRASRAYGERADARAGPHEGASSEGSDAHAEKSGGMTGHVHAAIPRTYEAAYVPSAAWTSARMIARGKEVYAERCAVCHGERGDGKGPAGVALPVRPPNLRDQSMVAEMRGNYWFWRVSEGGVVEPFKSTGSAMPAWKAVLSVVDRWAVIAYEHTFSGHTGPHVASEHPEMGGAHHHGAAERPGAPRGGEDAH